MKKILAPLCLILVALNGVDGVEKLSGNVIIPEWLFSAWAWAQASCLVWLAVASAIGLSAVANSLRKRSLRAERRARFTKNRQAVGSC